MTFTIQEVTITFQRTYSSEGYEETCIEMDRIPTDEGFIELVRDYVSEDFNSSIEEGTVEIVRRSPNVKLWMSEYDTDSDSWSDWTEIASTTDPRAAHFIARLQRQLYPCSFVAVHQHAPRRKPVNEK